MPASRRRNRTVECEFSHAIIRSCTRKGMSPPLAADKGEVVAKSAAVTNIEQILRHRLNRRAGIRIGILRFELGAGLNWRHSMHNVDRSATSFFGCRHKSAASIAAASLPQLSQRNRESAPVYTERSSLYVETAHRHMFGHGIVRDSCLSRR